MKCTNGHLFCLNCIGRWLFKSMKSKNHPPSSKPLSDQSAYVETLFNGLLVRPTNQCPTCAISGGFTMAPEVDLRLGQQLVLCSMCEWAGPFVDYPQHRHSYTPKVRYYSNLLAFFFVRKFSKVTGSLQHWFVSIQSGQNMPFEDHVPQRQCQQA